MGKVIINRDRCKACYLCVDSCPNKILEADEEVNVLGYYPVKANENKKCIGCAICARVCPDMAIEKVYR